MKIEYTKIGDYLYPDLELTVTEQRPIGKYGAMRLQYLKEHRPVVYHKLAMKEELYPHLWKVQDEAKERVSLLMEQLLLKNPAPNKEENQMAWVAHMNSLKAQAEEIVIAELIYS